MKYIVFKKHSKKTNKPYYELCTIEEQNGAKVWQKIGFVDVIDKTNK